MGTDKHDAVEEDFASLFENSYSAMEAMEPGQAIETDIVSISGDSIFLQLSGKSEGVLDKEELTDKDGNLTVKEGEQIKVYFLEAKNGEMRFTTRISGSKAGQAILENAFNNGIPVEGVVEKEIKGGFEVKIGASRAFCPYSQMGAKRVEDASVYVGRHMTFKIMEHGENGRNILVSNRIIHEEERQKKIEELKKELKEGMVVKGTVTRVQGFGAFVDLGGVQALLPVSEISRVRVEDINKEITLGQEVEAAILKLDWQNEKISISMKALQADPWDTAKSKYSPDSKHEGKVVRITDFGAFVSLEPGLDGLIHISDMQTDSRDSRPEDILKKGQAVSVLINSVDENRKRISLRPVDSNQETPEYKKYMEEDTETYNPFAELLKDKASKSKKKK
ncbi:MAG: 30S ribosomal protein S1 [Spirochaetales bacterium]|nr:30S ribosomal protein S1 [Spirochaetales bacterium]